MNRPRESLLTLFDPLFSGEPTTPPFRDAPSPDLGSDKENAAPPDAAGDSPITLTKFFSRTYTRHKAQLSQPLTKGRLIDFGDPSASDYSDSDDERDLVVGRETEPTGAEDAQGSPQRRPLADIALGNSRSSPIAMKKTLPTAGASSSPFGSPSPFKLVRPSPAPSSSPLASVINAINGATSPSPSSTPSAPRIAVTPAEPSSPSPTRQQLRPSAMLHVFPENDPRRTSVDLQASLSVHFDGSSFDLLKENFSLPENDSLGDLEMDMEIGVQAKKVPVKGYQDDRDATSSTNAESEDELDIDGLLAERLCDVNLSEDEVEQKKDEDKDNMSTPPAQLASCSLPTPQAPVRQFVRPKTKLQVPGAPTISSRTSALFSRRSARTSITALPIPASTAALRITKKAKPEGVVVSAAAPVAARQSAGGVFSGPAPTCSSSSVLPPRTMALGGVQRPPAHAKVPTAASASTSARVPSQPNKKMASQVPKVGVAGAAGPRPSGLRAPTSRSGVAGTALRRASIVGGPTRPSTTVGGRFGSSGVTRAVSVTGKGESASSTSVTARMMRRV